MARYAYNCCVGSVSMLLYSAGLVVDPGDAGLLPAPGLRGGPMYSYAAQ